MASLPKDELLQIFRETGALLEGHFILTSGRHSPQYFQCAKVLQYPKYLHLLAGEIAKHYEYADVELVVSPAVGGIVVGTEVGRMLGVRTIFSERENGAMTLRRGFEVRKGERVLVVEDVVTTGGSVEEVIGIARNAGALVTGAGAIVDRSNGQVRLDAKMFAVLAMDVVSYPADSCPLCAKGVPAEKPGSRSLR